jgi:hypothetical protein
MLGTEVRSDVAFSWLKGIRAGDYVVDTTPIVLHRLADEPQRGGIPVSSVAWMEGFIDEAHLVCFVNRLGLVISRRGDAIDWWAPSNADPGVVDHVLLETAIPYALALRGAVLLHASAVATNGEVTAFLGPSGAGKSTMAVAMAKHRSNTAVLSDDCLRLVAEAKSVRALPGHRSIRMWPDSARALVGGETQVDATGKTRIERDEINVFVDGMLELRTLVLLDRRDIGETSLTTLDPGSAFMAVVAHRFDLDLGQHDYRSDVLERFAPVIACAQTVRLTYRSDLSQLGPLAHQLDQL